MILMPDLENKQEVRGDRWRPAKSPPPMKLANFNNSQ